LADDDYFVCQARGCGRPLVLSVHEDELDDWLIVCSYINLKTIVRCPRHLTQWSCREAGVPWCSQTRAWIVRSITSDLKRYPYAVPNWSFPVPISENVKSVKQRTWTKLIFGDPDASTEGKE
jgi:hypothetical protein